MKTFSDLFYEAQTLPPKDRASFVGTRLSAALSGTNIEICSVDSSPEPNGSRALIGVAPYSLPDLALLDALKRSLAEGENNREHIQIFDVLTCATISDFERYIPGIGNVYQTPVIGIWEDGALTQKASGAEARGTIIRRYSLNIPQ
jgi:hypothetical protein